MSKAYETPERLNYDENNLKPYKIVVKFDATNQADAEVFVNDMNPKDWLEHLEEDDVIHNKGFASCDTEELDSTCESLFGHTDWEFVEDTNKYITIKFNTEDTREEEE